MINKIQAPQICIYIYILIHIKILGFIIAVENHDKDFLSRSIWRSYESPKLACMYQKTREICNRYHTLTGKRLLAYYTLNDTVIKLVLELRCKRRPPTYKQRDKLQKLF